MVTKTVINNATDCHSRSPLSGNPDAKELDVRLRTSGMTIHFCVLTYKFINITEMARQEI